MAREVRALLAMTVMVASIAACGAAETRDTAPSPLLAFEAVSCSREVPGQDSLRTTIQRDVEVGKVVFVVRHPDACGMSTRNPTFVVEQEVLHLRYEREPQDGMNLMCDCEYRAKFTFDRSMEGIERVRFGDGPVQQVR